MSPTTTDTTGDVLFHQRRAQEKGQARDSRREGGNVLDVYA